MIGIEEGTLRSIVTIRARHHRKRYCSMAHPVGRGHLSHHPPRLRVN
jgi:hypothetical protein